MRGVWPVYPQHVWIIPNVFNCKPDKAALSLQQVQLARCDISSPEVSVNQVTYLIFILNGFQINRGEGGGG